MGSQSNGEAGIRTLDGLASMPVFKTGAIGRSATSPSAFQVNSYSRIV